MKMIITIILMITSFTVFALANPAATNCINQGYKYLLIKNIGYCIFPDHSYCEEWAFFRGQCKPGQKKQVKNLAPKKISLVRIIPHKANHHFIIKQCSFLTRPVSN